MKSQKYKRIIVLLLVTAMAVAIPSSFAKYAGSVQVKEFAVKKSFYWLYNTYKTGESKVYYSANSALSKQEYTHNTLRSGPVELPYPGKYAIIVKGGDGSDGYSWNNHESTLDIEGGLGGTVVGIYVTTEPSQYVYVAPGSAGLMPKTTYSTGFNWGIGAPGGTNVISNYNGGDGKCVTQLSATFSSEPSAGSAGAASAVYRCDSNGNYDASKDLLIVAGGGGSAASWNEGYSTDRTKLMGIYKTYLPGDGGNGASNYGNVTDSMIERDAYVFENGSFVSRGKAIAGLNGGGTYELSWGNGGFSRGGLGGSIGSVLTGILDGAIAENGYAIGKGGDGEQYAGAGGGGYRGGGGGAGTSITYTAGGGGGGSSYVSYIIQQDDKVEYNKIIEAATSTDNPIPKQHSSDGYIIIKYLGPGEGSSDTVKTKSQADAMNEITNLCKDYKNASISNDNDKTNEFYSAIMSNDFAGYLLENRAWKITTDKNGSATIIFSDPRTTNITKNEKFWRYTNGTFSSATAKQSISFLGYSYGYPSDSTWKVDNSFVLS